MIHRIRIQNFKSLRDVTVDLSPVTVFIGKSGTGKMNFAEAIRFLRDYLSSGARKVIVAHRLGNKTLELDLRQESDGFRDSRPPGLPSLCPLSASLRLSFPPCLPLRSTIPSPQLAARPNRPIPLRDGRIADGEYTVAKSTPARGFSPSRCRRKGRRTKARHDAAEDGAGVASDRPRTKLMVKA